MYVPASSVHPAGADLTDASTIVDLSARGGFHDTRSGSVVTSAGALSLLGPSAESSAGAYLGGGVGINDEHRGMYTVCFSRAHVHVSN